jgi:hypothetical protein|tara:strand:- start:1122 stop:1370 length:249 start_codon:yes stop_codon:yes gene_type:complete
LKLPIRERRSRLSISIYYDETSFSLDRSLAIKNPGVGTMKMKRVVGTALADDAFSSPPNPRARAPPPGLGARRTTMARAGRR